MSPSGKAAVFGTAIQRFESFHPSFHKFSYRKLLSSSPRSLAFDFDGILCNGLKEYFQTAWRVYCQTWTVSSSVPSDGLAERFYRLRPVVEVGWEMPVVLRAAMKGFSDQDILAHWPETREKLVRSEDLSIQTIGQRVDGARDRWIQTELDTWLDLHEFYPGVLERLKQFQSDDFPFVIVTTKESRFVKRLLLRAGIMLGDEQIFGKDCKRPKPKTLKLLKDTLPSPIWFVEDRIAALKAVQAEPGLEDVGLFLGDWGYNLEGDRRLAAKDPSLNLLSLEQFGQDFDQWVTA